MEVPSPAPIIAPVAAPAIFPLLLLNLEDPKSPPAKALIVLPVFWLHSLFEINLLFLVLPVVLIFLLRLGAEPGTPFAVTFNQIAGCSAALRRKDS